MIEHSDAACNYACEYGLPCTGRGFTILGGIPNKVSPETGAIFAPAFEALRKFKIELLRVNDDEGVAVS